MEKKRNRAIKLEAMNWAGKNIQRCPEKSMLKKQNFLHVWISILLKSQTIFPISDKNSGKLETAHLWSSVADCISKQSPPTACNLSSEISLWRHFTLALASGSLRVNNMQTSYAHAARQLGEFKDNYICNITHCRFILVLYINYVYTYMYYILIMYAIRTRVFYVHV